MYASLISSARVCEHHHQTGWLTVDCRYDLADPGAGRAAWLAAHVPGAVYADLGLDLSDPASPGGGRHPLPPAAEIRSLFSRLGIDAGTQVVLYDDASGSVAARAWWMLHYLGHRAAAVMDGGWQAWLAGGYPVETGERAGSPRVFQGTPDTARLATLDDFPLRTLLVDSREPERYQGAREPLDPVAGHIPGAVNYYWKSNIMADGRFHPPGRLKRQFAALFGDSDPAAAVFYCGSGVTACHNLLAAQHAGYPLPRLYAGSWSQWCRRPERPVATGLT